MASSMCCTCLFGLYCSVLCALCSLVLILSGDINLNPGPIIYPCSICGVPVKSNQKAILCDGCDLWTHIRCGGVSEDKYSDYQDGEDTGSWVCPRCLAESLPFHDCSVISTPSSTGRAGQMASLTLSPSGGSGSRWYESKSTLNFMLLNVRSLMSVVCEIHDLLINGMFWL